MFMSYAVVSNIQYRMTPVDGGTLITFGHSALGFIPEEHRAGLQSGWTLKLEHVCKNAEQAGRS